MLKEKWGKNTLSFNISFLYLYRMKAIVLLKKIVGKGGIIGSAGRLYLNDEKLATQYIIECSYQLKAKSMKKLWGSELVKQIALFRRKNRVILPVFLFFYLSITLNYLRNY